ncbi:MAG: adenylosuccinate synthase [Acidobacteria bacterium]|nr:MAG: adenylosuccinate synthase [Acidobacteriota bacterium]
MKQNLAVVGVQWGDEGKGKVVDILSPSFDCVARYQGGHNAGHTINVGSRRHVLHLIPSGIFQPRVKCVIGSGVVLDPLALIEESEAIQRATSLPMDGRLFVSNRCHLILPYHRVVEAATENQLGERRIGTTSRGIGPAYEDKMGRRGLRVCDLMDSETLPGKIRDLVAEKNRTLEALKCPQRIDPEPILDAYAQYSQRIRPSVTDTSAYLNDLIRSGGSILFEGAQGTLLDVDHGTFPFVTSSSAAAGGVSTGLGISPKHVHRIVGVAKAYTTRVGAGPFPTESTGAEGDQIRDRGSEYGSTTGRPRRCGWFDGPAARYATMVNALDSIVITKIDVLDTFAQIPFCVDYKYRGSPLEHFPADAAILDSVEPVYKVLRGWQTPLAGMKEWSDLPAAAQDYLKFLSGYLGVPVSMISTGPDRDETIHLEVSL